APTAQLPTLSRSFGSQRHVSLAKSVRRKRTALNYNYHRAAGRNLCRQLKSTTG
ncbi:unnamed protein product, partial [Brassica rapa subsp. trilocularis]